MYSINKCKQDAQTSMGTFSCFCRFSLNIRFASSQFLLKEAEAEEEDEEEDEDGPLP